MQELRYQKEAFEGFYYINEGKAKLGTERYYAVQPTSEGNEVSWQYQFDADDLAQYPELADCATEYVVKLDGEGELDVTYDETKALFPYLDFKSATGWRMNDRYPKAMLHGLDLAFDEGVAAANSQPDSSNRIWSRPQPLNFKYTDVSIQRSSTSDSWGIGGYRDAFSNTVQTERAPASCLPVVVIPTRD